MRPVTHSVTYVVTHRFPAGVRVPRLERANKKRRASASIKMNAAATMHFVLASINIMGSLVKAAPAKLTCTQHLAWMAWCAHVELVQFLVHHSYHAATAPGKLDELVATFDRAFARVEAWKGYEKPKMHPFKHLSQAHAPRPSCTHKRCMCTKNTLRTLVHTRRTLVHTRRLLVRPACVCPCMRPVTHAVTHSRICCYAS